MDRYEYANVRQTRGRRKTYRGLELARVRAGGSEQQLLLYICPEGDNNNDEREGEKYSRRSPLVSFIELVTTTGRELEYVVDRIIDSRWGGPDSEYLVRWAGFGEEEDTWETRRELEECEALEIWMSTYPED